MGHTSAWQLGTAPASSPLSVITDNSPHAAVTFDSSAVHMTHLQPAVADATRHGMQPTNVLPAALAGIPSHDLPTTGPGEQERPIQA